MQPNYPGGFQATEILVFLYADGRTNFTISADADHTLPAWQTEPEAMESIRMCKSLKTVNVAGLDWAGIIDAANRAADEMRGCTWDEFCSSYRYELTPSGEQAVIPGCERNLAPARKQLDLFG